MERGKVDFEQFLVVFFEDLLSVEVTWHQKIEQSP